MRRLALFDPNVNVAGAFPSDYLPEVERLVAAGGHEDRDAPSRPAAALGNPRPCSPIAA